MNNLKIAYNSFTMKEHYSFELLNDYTDGILDKNKAAAVKKHLRQCESCRNIVAGIQHYYDSHGDDRTEWENYLDQFGQKQQALITQHYQKKDNVAPIQQAKTAKNWRTTLLKIAAVLLLGLLVAVPFYHQNFGNTHPTEIASHYLSTPYGMDEKVMSGQESMDATWHQAVIAYDNKAYDKAIQIMENMLVQGKADAKVHFYLGLSYLYQPTAEPSKVLKAFQKANELNPYLYGDKALWFSSLVHLQNDNITAAAPILEQITTEKMWKHQEARKILSKIK